MTSEWNGLPDGVKEAKKVADFKRLYRRHRADTERKPLGNTRLVVQQEQEHPRQGSTWTAEDHLNQDQDPEQTTVKSSVEEPEPAPT